MTFGGKNRFPIWSADGQRIAFQSDREGDTAIFWQAADGTGTAERLTKPDKDTAHVPESWRAFTATAIYAGLRKGELCGLRKCDVDIDAGLITIRCSYDRETTKGGHADVIRIAPALNIGASEIDEGLKILGDSFATMNAG